MHRARAARRPGPGSQDRPRARGEIGLAGGSSDRVGGRHPFSFPWRYLANQGNKFFAALLNRQVVRKLGHVLPIEVEHLRVFYPFLDFGLALATAIPQALFQNFRFDGDVDDTCLRIAASGFFDNGAGNVDDDNPALFQVIVDLWGDSVRQVVGVPMESEPEKRTRHPP